MAGKVGEELSATRRVHHLGMEHDAVIAPSIVGDDGEGCALGGAGDAEARRDVRHPVAMAHPHLLALAAAPDAIEERAILRHIEHGAAEFAVVGTFHRTAQLGA